MLGLCVRRVCHQKNIDISGKFYLGSFNEEYVYNDYINSTTQFNNGHIGTPVLINTMPKKGGIIGYEKGFISGSTDSSTFTPSIVDIVDYGSASKYKTVRSFDGADMNGSGTEINLTSGLWLSTSAITSITLTTTGGYAFRAGTTFALYGIKGA